MSERGEATQRTRQGKAGAAAPPGRSTVHLRLALLAVALVLPTVSLVLLGSLWLWQHGYVLYWAMGTCIAVTGAYLLERRLMLPLPPAAVASLQEGEPGDKAWTPRQEEAWADPGPTMKRFMPKDRGKAYNIMKRTSHLVVTLDERQ